MSMATRMGPRSLFLAVCLSLAASGVLAQPELHTSPIDITGSRISIEAVAPDRESGAIVPVSVPGFGPGLKALTETPVNLLFDARWNGTPDQQAAGTSARQLACDGTGGIKETIISKVAAIGRTAFDLSCDFVTTGSVFVTKAPQGLYVSYQLFGNSGKFRVRNDVADAGFSLKFALEVTTLIHTGSTICSLSADPPLVLLHAVQIEPDNAAASIYDFLNPSELTKMELGAQAKERTTSITLNDAFKELQDACGRGDIVSKVIAKFSDLETDITLPKGVTFRAVHPPIGSPRFQNVALPAGEFTCVAGYVWRNAYDGDVVCVNTARQSETRDENSLAESRRNPAGGEWGEATCLAGFVWRVAKPDDLVCVLPHSRDLVAEENASAKSRWVLGAFPTTPSLTRPSITAPPVVKAGASFQVGGQFFPPNVDASRMKLLIDRDATAVCTGGSSQLEAAPLGQPATRVDLAPSGNMSSCAYSHELVGLLSATAYRFRVRDCDFITCSRWSAPFETTTLSPGSGPGPVELTLDTGEKLGAVPTDAAGAFTATVQLPAGTVPGPHSLTAATGDRGDTIDIRVTPLGGETATLMVTASFFGDVGCPMRELDPPKIAAREPFPLFGTGFSPGTVTLYLDTTEGQNLGTATVASDGTFCSDFAAIPLDHLGSRTLLAVQDNVPRSAFVVEVVYVPPIH